MPAALRLGAMSYSEYLTLERSAATKHEYVNGEVYALAGGSPEHARLAASLIALLPTTEVEDRGEKWAHYQRLDSLAAYVLVAVDMVHANPLGSRGESST